MTVEAVERPPGHAFISYVREDSDRVARLQRLLEAAGIRVWRDTADLWPGQDWRIEIRRAITEGSLAFIACFSEHSEKRETSYQNEELVLAVEQMRRRPPGRSWLIPVRFEECALPQFDLGAGRTLDSLQRIDLFDENWEHGSARLVETVMRILSTSESSVRSPSGPQFAAPFRDLGRQVRSVLLASDRQIELEDLVADTLREVRQKLQDSSVFPMDSAEFASTTQDQYIRYVANRAQQYTDIVRPLVEVVIPGCAWGRPQHEVIWARLMQEVANACRQLTGKTVLVNLQRFPMLPVMYAAGLAALIRRNYGALRSVVVDAKYRALDGAMPVIGAMNPLKVFEGVDVAANVLALECEGNVVSDDGINALCNGRKGKRYTPVSDYLHSCLHEFFRDLIFDDEEYEEVFDELEVMLAMIVHDQKVVAANDSAYFMGAWLGRFAWRQQHSRNPIEKRVQSAILTEAGNWPPLQVGLFGGSPDRAAAAAEGLVHDVERRRAHFW